MSFNTKKSPMHHLKRIIFTLLKKKQKPQVDYDNEIDDNIANELLENQIFEEIDICEEDSAVSVFTKGHVEVVPVARGQRYIPVHFARTEAGTFFWTSVMGPDSDFNTHGDKNAITYYQHPELQVPADRWAQA